MYLIYFFHKKYSEFKTVFFNSGMYEIEFIYIWSVIFMKLIFIFVHKITKEAILFQNSCYDISCYKKWLNWQVGNDSKHSFQTEECRSTEKYELFSWPVQQYNHFYCAVVWARIQLPVVTRILLLFLVKCQKKNCITH